MCSTRKGGLESLLRRLRYAANPGKREAWNKGGPGESLPLRAVTTDATVGWADEMGVGLVGTASRVWGRRGVKVTQKLQLVRESRYLHHVVDPASDRFWQFWSQTACAQVARTLVECIQRETDRTAIIRDRAPRHLDATVRAVGLPLIEQPRLRQNCIRPNASSRTSARTEGRVHATIEDNMDAVNAVLPEVDADPIASRALRTGTGSSRPSTSFPTTMRRNQTGLVLRQLQSRGCPGP